MPVFSFTYPETYRWAVEVDFTKINKFDKLMTKTFERLNNSNHKIVKKYIIFFNNGQKVELDNIALISDYTILEKRIIKISIVFRKEDNAIKVSLGRMGSGKGPNVLYYVKSPDEIWYNNTIIIIQRFLEKLKLSYSFLFNRIFINFRRVFYIFSIIAVIVLMGKEVLMENANLQGSLSKTLLDLMLAITIIVIFWAIPHIFRYLFP